MTLDQALSRLGKEIIDDAKANLQKNKKGKSYNTIASGELYKSLIYKVNDNELSFDMAEYGKYVDGGRKKGKYMPIDKLAKWMKLRGIDEKYQYVINRAIKENGIKPTHFFTDSYDDHIQELEDLMDEYVDELLDDLVE